MAEIGPHSPPEEELASQIPHESGPATQTPQTQPFQSHAESSQSQSQSQPHGQIEEDDQEALDAVLQAETTIDVSDRAWDSDPAYDSDTSSVRSQSLASTIMNYPFENGRRYHKFREGAYVFPNDDSEQDREDMKHGLIMNLCGGKLHFAPIPQDPHNIIDIGTGTGIWAIEMGDAYPSASVLGIDLSPIQPKWLPPNVKFLVDDTESPWVDPLNHYDFVHARHMAPAIKNWPRLLERAFDHIKPGGWIEVQEFHHYPQCHDGTMAADYLVEEYWRNIIQGLGNLGVDLNFPLTLATKMRDAGFTNVTERIFNVPIGTWPKNRVLKNLGMFWRAILLEGIQAIALGPLTRGLHWSREEVEVWLVQVRKAYTDTKTHSFMPFYVVYGQKPRQEGDSGSGDGDW
ncbi:MAG: hypothetical protein M1834_006735 [Cirrosporium novae-zelandiae]|nr:MAG: hypothetical protein M1834_006735 [Cirrosporium novae-zelandiae]